jgi:ufm1-conjugating enzyme 1
MDGKAEKSSSGNKAALPAISTRAGPRDGALWTERLKEELTALIEYVRRNKAKGNDWVFLEPQNPTGTAWKGHCSFVSNMLTYKFQLQFELPVSYPQAPFQIQIPSLDGKTVKSYRGGKICLSVHFEPLWKKNVPHFGIVHALQHGLAPWLASEVPSLVDRGIITHEQKSSSQ